jgi:hypothetical protein
MEGRRLGSEEIAAEAAKLGLPVSSKRACEPLTEHGPLDRSRGEPLKARHQSSTTDENNADDEISA